VEGVKSIELVIFQALAISLASILAGWLRVRASVKISLVPILYYRSSRSCLVQSMPIAGFGVINGRRLALSCEYRLGDSSSYTYRYCLV
jgi:hypothetical protein